MFSIHISDLIIRRRFCLYCIFI